MNAAEARALLFQRKLAEMPIETSLPDLQILDGKLSMLELSGADMTKARKMAMDEKGDIDDILAGAAMICFSLVLRETKELILNPTDMTAVSAWGGTVITPLMEAISQASGFSAEDTAKAKASFLPTVVSDSNSSYVESSAVVLTTNGANA